MKKGELLIQELLADFNKFNKEQKAYELLQEYFKGFPIETLKPLLESENKSIQSPAIWIVSELGEHNCNQLLNWIIPLLSQDSDFIRYYAMECVLLGTFQFNNNEFSTLVLMLLDNSEFIRISAMRLISKANNQQIEASFNRFDNDNSPLNQQFRKGLKKLLSYKEIENTEILEMETDSNSLIRRFAAIIALKIYKQYPEILLRLTTSNDTDIQKFAKNEISILA